MYVFEYGMGFPVPRGVDEPLETLRVTIHDIQRSKVFISPSSLNTRFIEVQ